MVKKWGKKESHYLSWHTFPKPFGFYLMDPSGEAFRTEEARYGMGYDLSATFKQTNQICC